MLNFKTTLGYVLIALCLFAYSPVWAQTSPQVDITTGEVTLKHLIQEIEKQTDYTFVFDNSISQTSKITLKEGSGSVENVLKKALSQTNISFEIVNKQILLKENDKKKSSQTIKKPITGKIIDATGEAIIGASIIEKGTTNGTITNIDGEFSLMLTTDQSSVDISYIGYQQTNVKIGKESKFTITLAEDAQALDEVVVVGYGVQKKVNLTGAVAFVDGDALAKRPVTNATQSLQGLAPGLFASTGGGGGTPGESLKLNIRGQGNLSNSDSPYVLVDGVEMSLSDVNPNDIENISVLKDAAAASIYGARAAYGVILVTTKKGEEGKVKVSYQGNVGWSTPTHLPEMANGFEFAQYFNAGSLNAGNAPQYSQKQLDILEQYVKDPTGINSWPIINNNQSMSTEYENNSNGVGNTDWFKFHYRNFALKQNHNLSVSGGGKSTQYYISGGYYNEEGLLKYADIDYARYNINANITTNLTNWAKVKFNTKFSNQHKDSPFGTGAIDAGMFYHGLARFRPTVSPYDLNGNYSELSQVPYLKSGTYSKNEDTNFTLTGGFELQPIKNWRVFGDYTYKQGTTDYKALGLPGTFYGVNGESYKQVRSELGLNIKGSFSRMMATSKYQSINFYSNYMFTLAQKHNFILLAGYQEEDYNLSKMQTNVTDLISTNNPGLGLSNGDKNIYDVRNGWATRGFFGRINYDYDGRYLIEGNIRYDGSSRFISSNRWGAFPSVSVGWNISREEFMTATTNYISNLKLRGSYGLLGNQSGAGLYTFAQTMGHQPMGNWYFANGREMYINAPGSYDPNTTWEKVESMNIGVDFGLFNNQLTGSFEVFERKTKDMLGPSADFADMYGASAPNTNNASLRNKGWELALNWRGKIGKDISYSVGGMVSDATMEVTKFENPTKTDPVGQWYVGRSAGEIWGYKVDGIIQTKEEADEYNKHYDTSFLTGVEFKPGDLKFIDINGDNKINQGNKRVGDMGDLSIIGNTTPRYQFSFNGMISWKGLSLSTLFQGVGKRDYNPGGSVYFYGSSSYAQVTVFKEHLDYWTPENPNAYYPAPYISGAGNINSFKNKTQQTSDRYLLNAAYLRLKNLTVSYELPRNWISKAKLSNVMVFFSGENLFTATKLPSFFDPELVFVAGDGGKNYPLNRVLSLGVNLNF